MKDWLIRSLKTFVQAFLGVLIPEVIAWCANITSIDWASWRVWALPVIGAALAGGISAVWNKILESRKIEHLELVIDPQDELIREGAE